MRLSQLDGEAATGAQQAVFKLIDQFLGLMLDPFVDGRSGAGRRRRAGARLCARARGAAARRGARLCVGAQGAAVYKAPRFEQRWSAWGTGLWRLQQDDGDRPSRQQ